MSPTVALVFYVNRMEYLQSMEPFPVSDTPVGRSHTKTENPARVRVSWNWPADLT